MPAPACRLRYQRKRRTYRGALTTDAWGGLMARDSTLEPGQVAKDEVRGDPVGYFYTWWRGDPLPSIPMPSDLLIERLPFMRVVGTIPGTEDAEVCRRLEHGHRLWQARVGDCKVAWGWVATLEASIGQLGV